MHRIIICCFFPLPTLSPNETPKHNGQESQRCKCSKVELHLLVSRCILHYNAALMITFLRKACTAVSASRGKEGALTGSVWGKYCLECTSGCKLLWYCSLKCQHWFFTFDKGKCAFSSCKKLNHIWGDKRFPLGRKFCVVERTKTLQADLGLSPVLATY